MMQELLKIPKYQDIGNNDLLLVVNEVDNNEFYRIVQFFAK